jgi:aldose 1-epimerase
VIAQVGAGLRALTHGDASLVDGYGDDEIAQFAQGQALVPWPNRIADGRYAYGGQDLQLALTEPEKQCAIHGLARWLRWEVVEADETRALLRTPIAAQAGYPFPLSAEVEYTLAPGALTVRTTLRNDGAQPAPAGVGFHPYLTVGTGSVDEALLQSPAAERLEADDRGIPSGARVPVAGTEHDFGAPRAIGDLQLDTAYTSLRRDDDGRARVRLSSDDRSVALWLGEGFDYLMLFTGDALADPARRRRALGVEPMTCAPNAYNSGDGLATLEPGGGAASWEWGLELQG